MALERPLELWELTHAVKGMNGGKTPGRDGLPVEFYRALWANIQQPYMDAISASLHSGQLGQSLTQGVITLIPKPGKDPSRLNNWRPITLLNCDYKILAKALAHRLKRVLPRIISKDQRGFMSGQYIGENIRVALDIIDSMRQDPTASGLLLSLDFEKAFTVRLQHS